MNTFFEPSPPLPSVGIKHFSLHGMTLNAIGRDAAANGTFSSTVLLNGVAIQFIMCLLLLTLIETPLSVTMSSFEAKPLRFTEVCR
jgi:hypothetical protein